MFGPIKNTNFVDSRRHATGINGSSDGLCFIQNELSSAAHYVPHHKPTRTPLISPQPLANRPAPTFILLFFFFCYILCGQLMGIVSMTELFR